LVKIQVRNMRTETTELVADSKTVASETEQAEVEVKADKEG